jgi:ketosteroid isomerase-like protein
MDANATFDILPAGPVRRVFEAISRRDLDAMVQCFAEDYINETPAHPDRSFVGRDQVRRNWSALLSGFPDLESYVLRATTAADGLVWVEWGQQGTRADGVRVELAAVAIFRIEHDLISAVRFYLEPVERQTGDVNANVASVVGATAGGERP